MTATNGVVGQEPEVPVQGRADSNQDREAAYALCQVDVCELMMLAHCLKLSSSNVNAQQDPPPQGNRNICFFFLEAEKNK